VIRPLTPSPSPSRGEGRKIGEGDDILKAFARLLAHLLPSPLAGEGLGVRGRISLRRIDAERDDRRRGMERGAFFEGGRGGSGPLSTDFCAQKRALTPYRTGTPCPSCKWSGVCPLFCARRPSEISIRAARRGLSNRRAMVSRCHRCKIPGRLPCRRSVSGQQRHQGAARGLSRVAGVR